MVKRRCVFFQQMLLVSTTSTCPTSAPIPQLWWMLVANGSHQPPSPKACPWLKEILSPGETGHLYQGQLTTSDQLKVYVYKRGQLYYSPVPSPLSSTISVPSFRSNPWDQAEARLILKPHLCPAPSPGPLCFPYSVPHTVPLLGWSLEVTCIKSLSQALLLEN